MKIKSGNRHPWDKWFSRKRFTLKRDKHYACMPHSMSVQVRNAAAKRGLSVSVLIDEETITVTVV